MMGQDQTWRSRNRQKALKLRRRPWAWPCPVPLPGHMGFTEGAALTMPPVSPELEFQHHQNQLSMEWCDVSAASPVFRK